MILDKILRIISVKDFDMKNLKMIVIVVVSLSVLIIVLQNTQSVETKLLFVTIAMPRAGKIIDATREKSGKLGVGTPFGISMESPTTATDSAEGNWTITVAPAIAIT